MSQASDSLVDLARLGERFDDDLELIGEIKTVFVTETPGRLEQIAAAVADGDLERLVRQAHSLKGVCGTIFAEPLRALSYGLEMAAREGRIDEARRLAPELMDLLRRTAAFLDDSLV